MANSHGAQKYRLPIKWAAASPQKNNPAAATKHKSERERSRSLDALRKKITDTRTAEKAGDTPNEKRKNRRKNNDNPVKIAFV